MAIDETNVSEDVCTATLYLLYIGPIFSCLSYNCQDGDNFKAVNAVFGCKNPSSTFADTNTLLSACEANFVHSDIDQKCGKKFFGTLMGYKSETTNPGLNKTKDPCGNVSCLWPPFVIYIWLPPTMSRLKKKTTNMSMKEYRTVALFFFLSHWNGCCPYVMMYFSDRLQHAASTVQACSKKPEWAWILLLAHSAAKRSVSVMLLTAADWVGRKMRKWWAWADFCY